MLGDLVVTVTDKKPALARHQWLMPTILANWEAEIGKIEV
jgi:hypothetical protein